MSCDYVIHPFLSLFLCLSVFPPSLVFPFIFAPFIPVPFLHSCTPEWLGGARPVSSPFTRSLASHLLTASLSRTLAIATPDSLKCISLQHWRISFNIYIQFRHLIHSFGIIPSLDIVGLIYSLGMFGRIYPSTRITNNRLDCAIEHRTLPTTTTHYYYPLPTDIGPYSIYLHFSECFTSDLSGIVFLSTLGFFGIHDHWPSLVFIVIGTINIGHHWHQYHGTSLDYRTTLTHLGDQPLDISKEHHYRTSLSS